MNVTDSSTQPSPERPSALAPLAHRAFLVLWLATVASNTGTWMNDVGAGWLMTTLSASPATVAMVQVATTLPVFLFALPAGALADIVDRRRLLLLLNAVMAAVAIAMAVLVAADAMTVELLLLTTFLLGTGAAFMAPAWAAIVPGLVPRADLPAAISLNSIGINVSRAIGPALAGVLIVAVGLWAPFLVNALSFVGILAALWFWRGEAPAAGRLPGEAFLPAMIAGLRYARRSTALQRTIARAVAFFAFASAFWALLPLVARDVLGGGSGLYGLLMGCVGAGAVIGGVALPRLRARFGPDRLVLLGALVTAAATGILALLPSTAGAVVAMLLAGGGWIAVLSTLQVAAQSGLPDWVRARGLSLFLTAFFGAMAAGASLWGLLAEAVGIALALGAAAAGLTVSAVVTSRIALPTAGGDALVASLHWPAPPPVAEDAQDKGPVMVTIDYTVSEEVRQPCLERLHRLRTARLRDGGYGWQVFELLEMPGVFREVFFVSSWLEHLRQHERVTTADAALQSEIRALCTTAPRVQHALPATPTQA